MTGKGAEQALYKERDILNSLASKANVTVIDLPEKMDSILKRQRDLENTVNEMQRKLAALEADELSVGAVEVEGVVVVARRVQAESIPAFRAMADGLREKMATGIGVLATEIDGKGVLLAVVTDDLVKRGDANAGQIVRSVCLLYTSPSPRD